MKRKPLPAEFFTVNVTLKEIKATEEDLARIYDAAYKGLTGDKLAIKSGYTPEQFRVLLEHDPLAARAAAHGPVDCEYKNSSLLIQSAENGDVKAMTTLLTHLHNWMPAKPEGDNGDIRIIVENAN